MFPFGIVPAGIGRVGDGEHPVRRRPAAPVALDPSLLYPDIFPVAVIRLSDDLNLNTGLGCRFFDKNRGVYGSRKRGIGGMKLEGAAQFSGLLQMELGLFRIVLSLGQFGSIVLVIPRDRVVVAHVAVTPKNRFHHLLTVDDVFESQPDIVVVIGFDGGQHGNGVMSGPLQLQDLNTG